MRKVCYLYNEDITKYEFSKEHPMKTKRMKMVHSLINNYSLSSQLRMFHSKEASSEELSAFHHPLYIKYLESWVSPKSEQIVEQYSIGEQERVKMREDAKLNSIFKINQTVDCPGFEGLYDFCKLAAGGSIDAADLIIAGEGDIVINWSGGYHHGKKSEASGFCYVNDIVLCILELLKAYPRVLYLDIDVHHGDGVEEAFFHTNRVFTVSFQVQVPWRRLERALGSSTLPTSR
jgi:histone deacetylase 1/2